jgi:hypothetical protein
MKHTVKHRNDDLKQGQACAAVYRKGPSHEMAVGIVGGSLNAMM